MDKVILHSDLNNFYASVECIMRPELEGKPVAVSGNPEKRHGVVLAKNQLAKSFGIKTGDTVLEAERKCPGIVFVEARHALYNEFSKRAKEIYYTFTDQIEPFGLDECWLDVTASGRLFGSGKDIAETIRRQMKVLTGGLTVSIGVSFTKTFAKLGSDMKKPDAITEISRDNYKQTAWKLPVSEMLYVGKSTLAQLNKFGIRTIGDLALCPDILLSSNIGKNGLKLKNTALGLHDDTVAVFHIKEPPKSVGHGTTTFKDMTDNATVKTVIFSLSDMVAMRLRRYGMYANGIAITVRDNLLRFSAKQSVLASSTQSAKIIAERAFELFKQHHPFPSALPVRAVSVTTFNLSQSRLSDQMHLFTDTEKCDKPERLERALDDIRERFGSNAVTRAAYMGNDYVLDAFSETDDETLPFYRG